MKETRQSFMYLINCLFIFSLCVIIMYLLLILSFIVLHVFLANLSCFYTCLTAHVGGHFYVQYNKARERLLVIGLEWRYIIAHWLSKNIIWVTYQMRLFFLLSCFHITFSLYIRKITFLRYDITSQVTNFANTFVLIWSAPLDQTF